MVFFIIILLFIMFCSAKIAPEGQFMSDYLSKEKTNSVKGIFVILVLFSHYSQYVKLGGVYDEPYLILQNHLNQMIVAMFLFYSGYGIIKSIYEKKYPYVKTVLCKRLPRVLVNFDIAVILFLIINLFLKKTFDIKTILLSLIGWKNVGNSNWYMFAIFVLYILTFLSFCYLKLLKGKHNFYVGMIILTVLSVGFVYSQIILKRPMYCYDTIILFALGGWYFLLKDKIEKIIMRNDIIYSMIFAMILVGYFVSFRFRWKFGIEGFTIWAVLFTVMVIVFTMKISFMNPMLEWFGKHVFSIYILQRIPMMVLGYFGIADSNKYMFLLLSFVFTIFIALVFDYFTAKIPIGK